MYRIGIDEVGRGPLAGPVVVGAVALPKGKRLPLALGELRDSKKMTKAAREAWANWVLANLVSATARALPKTIDVRNISKAANLCALRCYRSVIVKVGEQPVRLDGGLYLGSKIRQLQMVGIETAPKSDEEYREVSLASILAKVTRDQMMARYATKYPGYGFERHVGYGTKGHYEALKTLGPCPIHRLTFLGELGTIGLTKSRQ